jgi:hypothetical protein
LFDPTEPGHKTGPEWAAAGPHGWFMNLIVYTLAHGEARHNVCIGSLAMMPVAEPVYGWLRRQGRHGLRELHRYPDLAVLRHLPTDQTLLMHRSAAS